MIRLFSFEDNQITTIEKFKEIKERLGTPAWLDIENPSEKVFTKLLPQFGFHELYIMDCMEKNHNSKVSNNETYYFLVLNALENNNSQSEISYVPLYVFFSSDLLITIHWTKSDIIDDVLLRMKNTPETSSCGVDFVLYNLFDSIFDEHFPLLDKIDEKIDLLEDEIIENPQAEARIEILNLKKDLLKIRRSAGSQREVLNVLLRSDYALISKEARIYLMDAYDHSLKLLGFMENQHDMLSGALDLYHSQISNKTNDIMKVLTIITTIMMPLTLITGIYGMNFANMPELQTRYGYFVVLGIMALITICQFIFFKYKKWW